MTWKVREN